MTRKIEYRIEKIVSATQRSNARAEKETTIRQ